MINKIWALFIIIGIIYSILTGNTNTINTEIIKCGEASLNMIMNIIPVMALWLGIMKIAEESGLLKKISLKISPLIRLIFPEIPPSHESIGLITTTIIANLFGLGNASTPIGLKTMKSLQELNKEKHQATRSMITFLTLNTTGLTLIPTTLISLKMLYKSNNPTEIVIPCFLASLCATIGGIILDRYFARKEKKCKKYQH